MSSRNRVFIGKLPRDVRRRDIEDWLEDYNFKHYDNIHVKTGFAFVEFSNSRDADDCVKDMDRRDFKGSRITVELARGSHHSSRYEDDRRRQPPPKARYNYKNGYYRDRFGAPYNTEWKLSVENLSSRAGWQEIKDFFRQVGEVTYAECHREKTGEGIVEFSTREDLKRAIEKLDGKEFMGRKIKLADISTTSKSHTHHRSPHSSPERDSKRRRSSSGSHSRGRSRSRSRSTSYA